MLYRRVLERGARQRYEWAVVLEASGNFVMFLARVIRAIEGIAHGERDLSLSVERMGIATHDFQILIETRLSYDFSRRLGEKEPLGEGCRPLVSGEGWIAKTLTV